MALIKLNATQGLTGTLPAVSGANLTNIDGGKVLQVVTSNTSSTVTVTGNADTDTGLTANITPSATSSKIAIFANVSSVLKVSGDHNIDINLLRGSSIISSFCQDIADTGNSDYFSIGNQGVSYLDTPSSSSQLTYKVNFSKSNTNGSARVQQSSGMSTMIIMEISG